MNSDKMITLSKEKETLLVPLYGKAIDNHKKRPILYDVKAEEMVRDIDYDFKSLKIPGKTSLMMCLRAKLIDNFTKDFLKGKGNTVVIHLGCGLDSRCFRINSQYSKWFDLDFEDVICIRKEFFQESEKYQMITSSVTQPEWIEKIPNGFDNYLVIAEGLFMYLKEDEIKTLLARVKDRVGNFTLIFDAFSVYTAKKVMNHPSIKKTGAQVHWGLDDSKGIETWNSGYRFEKEIHLTSNQEIERLGWGVRSMYKLAHLIPMARNAQRILVYSI